MSLELKQDPLQPIAEQSNDVNGDAKIEPMKFPVSPTETTKKISKKKQKELDALKKRKEIADQKAKEQADKEANLARLADKAKSANDEIQNLGRQTTELALLAGEALAEAKKILVHGDFLPWQEKLGIPERTSQRYRQLFEYYQKLSAKKREALKTLPLSEAYEEISKEVRGDRTERQGQQELNAERERVGQKTFAKVHEAHNEMIWRKKPDAMPSLRDALSKLASELQIPDGWKLEDLREVYSPSQIPERNEIKSGLQDGYGFVVVTLKVKLADLPKSTPVAKPDA